MKKLFVFLSLVALLTSCKNETQEKLDAAKDAVTEEMKEGIDSAKVRAEKKLDSLKEKTKATIDSAKIKSAEKMEATAKKLKESVTK